jgi:glycosyltransferase involved in cell wall biosynthesis
MLDEARKRANDFDVIHFHLSHFQHFPFFENIAAKTVTTPHGRLDYADLAPAYARFPRFPMISISHSQKRGLPDANWLATIHHGLPVDLYQPCPAERSEEPYLAFLGRFSRDKRPDRAIEIAKRAGLKIKLAAKIGDGDRAYFHEAVEPLLDGDRVAYVGEIEEHQKARFLGRAAGLLFPIDWPEPFGLAVIEAMACGTPVIAWNCGAMPEIIDPGITGFVVEEIGEAVARVPELLQLDRGCVRAVFEKRFSAERMTRDYVAAYVRLLGHHSQARAS